MQIFSPFTLLRLRLRLPLRWLLPALLWTLSLLGPAAAARAADFLEPEQAFQLSAEVLAPDALRLHFKVAPGYYLYRERLHVEAPQAELAPIDFPAGERKFDPTFEKEVETYHHDLTLQVRVLKAAGVFELQVGSQGCAEAGLCYPPTTQALRVSLAAFGGDGSVRILPAGGAGAEATAPDAPPPADAGLSRWADSQSVEGVLRGGSWYTVVGAFFVMGLLLSFTPCVLPMLPILSSVIAGGGEVSRRRGLALAAAYSLGMAMVYTALGIAAGLAGEGLAAELQKPWVLALFASLLAVFALAMFDVYELRLPSGLANRLHGVSMRLPGGRFAGVFLMGGLSALIVSPCVSAPLAGALVFLSQTRNVPLAGSALFAMACGMSVPLLALGASAGAWLPRSGSWMHAVKHGFGLMLLAVAWYLLQPVLPAWAVLSGWAALCLVAGFMLRPFDAHPHSGAPRVWLQRALGLAALTLGVLELVGAASGAPDPLQPLERLTGRALAAETTPGPTFQPVRSVAELDQVLHSAGRPVMLDFYADWCVSCKEMERFTFRDPAVRARLAGAVLLKVDVTANTPEDRALLQRFKLFGPPGTIFFDARGQELQPLRVIGYREARDFEKTLQQAGL